MDTKSKLCAQITINIKNYIYSITVIVWLWTT